LLGILIKADFIARIVGMDFAFLRQYKVFQFRNEIHERSSFRFEIVLKIKIFFVNFISSMCIYFKFNFSPVLDE